MFNTYNLREFMAGVPNAEAAIIMQVYANSGHDFSTLHKHNIGGFTVPEGMLLDTESYKKNDSYFDDEKQITFGHKMYVIHKNGAVWDAISLAPYQFTTRDVLQEFKTHCDENEMTMEIDSQDWKLRNHCSGKSAGYSLVVDSVHKEASIKPIHNYPELIPGDLVLYPNGRTRTLSRVLKHIVRYSLYKLKDSYKRVLDAEDSVSAKRRFTFEATAVVNENVISLLRGDGLVEEIKVNRLKQAILRDLA